jgi:putative nucleotidyltransferase with HDIG domain
MTNFIEHQISRRDYNKNLLLGIRNLPSVPVVMLELTRLLDNPRTSAGDLGKLISKDQGLVTKILAVANSPLYGLPRRVSTIEFAIVILGFDHIKNIVIALSMMEAFKGSNEKGWNRQRYWNHSLLTAMASKRIADDLGYRKSGEVFTAGLLHDLGVSVTQRFFNQDFKKINEMVETQQISYMNSEKLVLGLTHEEIGQFLIEKWNLPTVLGDAVLFHHQPSLAETNKPLTAIVHLADYLTQHYMVGNVDWDENIELDLNIIEILKLADETYLENLINSYEQLYKDQIDSLTF